MTWRDFVYQNVIEYCDKAGSRTFTLQELLEDRLDVFKTFKPSNRHVEAKIRQQLQFLRDDNLIRFVDNSGHYTLQGPRLLEPEREETRAIDLTRETPERREYIIETYVRNVAWSRRAREAFGDSCLFENCNNTFRREDGSRYIEVHHIIPLCRGGEEGLWNLSVVCAHHHRMAHYSDARTQKQVANHLIRVVRRLL
jgi:predicted HNH restriction endonuclease